MPLYAARAFLVQQRLDWNRPRLNGIAHNLTRTGKWFRRSIK